MVESPPSASLVVAKPDLLFEVLVVALDAPAHFDNVDKTPERRLGGKRRQPVLGGVGLRLRPFDQQPFLPLLCLAPNRRRPPADARKAPGQRIGPTIAPADVAPGLFRQAQRQSLGAHARAQLALLANLAQLERGNDRGGI